MNIFSILSDKLSTNFNNKKELQMSILLQPKCQHCLAPLISKILQAKAILLSF